MLIKMVIALINVVMDTMKQMIEYVLNVMIIVIHAKIIQNIVLHVNYLIIF